MDLEPSLERSECSPLSTAADVSKSRWQEVSAGVLAKSIRDQYEIGN